MAHISRNNIITINRGDTFIYSFYIGTGSGMSQTVYNLQEGDKLYLGVCEPNQPFELAIIKKVFTYADANSDGSITIMFDSADTVNLLPGNYYYSIKLSQPISETSEMSTDEKITTVIPKTQFIIID